ncbi:ABC transporter permease [Desulfosporosinus sp. BICA1-9]|uniref:ABC transporter permease n=1 Tax=Desulfosporosinus sp. BICA1-9 TaxID=1531958 RepID=UPI00054C0E26|nr:ABC transporter permease [Desulfosporosinus sp. BICA1-9]KJS50570.1 MAG: ribose ABC transporter permease [Peptococcaceae bacterium BRH_c23]KJS82837.1 MAG: ribose ABC transporter permease [Desulfosporosinus sp. BICA1-9]
MGKDNKSNPLHRIYKSSTFGIVMILLVMCTFIAVLSDKFLTTDNLLSVFRAFSFVAIMAIGECLVIITGGIDLSVSSIFAFSGVISAMAMVQWGLPVPLAIMIGMAAGVAFGFANGIFITKLKLPPFIATLGILSIARGLSYGITGGYPIPDFPASFKFIGQGYIGIIPFPVILLILLGIIFSIFLRSTVFGRRIYAIGGNEEAARVSGINTDRTKIIVYCLSGLLAGIAGMATAARLGVAQSTAGMGYELDTIAAVIIGGTSVSGGVGTVFGAIIGAAIMGVLRNGLILLNVSAYWQQTVIGCVIILAVSADQLRYIRAKK